jgi:hypothetical protein
MKHYLHKFTDQAAYNTAKSGQDFYLPSVSLINSTRALIYDPEVVAWSFNPRYLYSDMSASTTLDSSKTVIGVEVIPAGHLGSGSAARFVSVKNMSRAEGEVENGSVAVGNSSENPAAMIPWGNYNDDIEGMTNYQNAGYKLDTDQEAITESNPYGIINELSESTDSYLATDFDNGLDGNVYPFFDGAFLPGYSTPSGSSVNISIPYPFNSDGTLNTLYSQNGNGMAVTDMAGAANTDILMARKTVTWSTGDALDTEVGDASEMSGKVNHPAAIACRRFNPASSNTSGQWYLPSAGELGYLFANIAKINTKIGALAEGQGVKLGVLNSQSESVDSLGYWLWSSSEYDDGRAWNLYLYGGSLSGNGKNGAGGDGRVRAFLSLQ